MKKSLVMLNSLIAMSFLSADATSEELSNFTQTHTEKPLSSALIATNQPSNPAEQTQRPDFTSQPRGVITPAVAPIVKHGVDLEISGDFIWWKTTVTGLEYAAAGISDDFFVSSVQDVKKGSIKSPKYQFEPGLKIALGMLFNHDGWDVNFEYTWLRQHQTKSSMTGKAGVGLLNSLLIAQSEGFFSQFPLFSASAKWKHSFNILDAELARNFFISRYLTLRPHVGMKFGWIDAKLKADYSIASTDLLSAPNFVNINHYKQNMWGLGIRAGVDTVWHFNKNWGMYGDIAFTNLWSFIHTKGNQTQSPIDLGVSGTVYTVNNGEKIQKIINIVEMGLGLSYMTWFKQDRYRLLVQAGWEEQVWLDFNNLLNVIRPNTGSLNIHGLTIKAAFAF